MSLATPTSIAPTDPVRAEETPRRAAPAPGTVPTVRLAAPGDPSSGTIVLAEDHEDSRDALRLLLEAFGYRVHVAGNGREAVAVARAVAPDLVLMDMMMPEVDGFQATRELRASPEFRSVPIVALTAMEGARERVLEAGCDDLVVKPIDVRRFLERVQLWVAPR